MKYPDLPINKILPDICAHLNQENRLIIQAAPGAGKTTIVPLTLLDQPWLGDKKILMLEPRRLATRNAAIHMAELLGEKVGERVGYRVQLESKVSSQTKLEIVTEGILTRRLQHDPELSDVGAIIFDEFHERSLQADLGLALCLDCQEGLREDLKLIVMSATLDDTQLSEMLGNCTTVRTTGRNYPVTERHLGPLPIMRNRRPDYGVGITDAVKTAITEDEGSILIFLPGEGEIRTVEKNLKACNLPANVEIHPLYGALPKNAQQMAIEKPKDNKRKIVLATNIAETSLTIEGIRIVIDSGYHRVMRYDPNKCLNRLETKRISLASATQRQGRAGRLDSGICYKLWDKNAEGSMRDFDPPEILNADLSSLALELANWGVTDIDQLNWLDKPSPALMNQAQALLKQLGALDENNHITEHGKRLIHFPTHPRLAHMIICAHELGMGETATKIAALLSEKDILKQDNTFTHQVNLELRLTALSRSKSPNIKRINSLADKWNNQLKKIPTSKEHQLFDTTQQDVFHSYPDSQTGLIISFAFPDRVAKQRTRDDQRYVMANKRGVMLDKSDELLNTPILVIADLDGAGTDSQVRLAAPIHITAFLKFNAQELISYNTATWHKKSKSIQKRKQTRLGKLILQDSSSDTAPQDEIITALFSGVRQIGLSALPFTVSAQNLIDRVRTARYWQPDIWPDFSEQHLLNHLEDWLEPYLTMNLDKIEHPNQLSKLDLENILLNQLEWEQQQSLNDFFPTHITVPSGSKIKIDYNDPENPVLPVKLQEMFGATETPTIMHGKVSLTLHLLSPAKRPLQITQNLVSFWQEAYQHVKAEMRGQYPKHPWPDDPMSHIPTRKTKHRLKD